MRFVFGKAILGVALGCALLAGTTQTARAEKISFKDPTGDDNGAGKYTYPTDSVYKRGSFDMTGFDVDVKGNKVEFAVTVNSPLEDPWRMGGGFSVQMFFVFVKTKDGGFKDGPSGTNVQFADGNEWNYVIILSPQPPGRVKTEVEQKMPAAAQAAVLVPGRTKGAGRTISGAVELEQLGGGDPSTWGYQVVVQSNEGFPAGKDLLTRKVNEFEGQHRFGGGTDYDCDPHAVDILGDNQAEQLKYECAEDGSAKALATLTMAHKK